MNLFVNLRYLDQDSLFRFKTLVNPHEKLTAIYLSTQKC